MTGQDLHEAIYAALTGNSALVAATQGIYSDVPDPADSEADSAFPYITFDEETALPFDSDDALGESLTFRVHVWSRTNSAHGRKAVEDMIRGTFDRSTFNVANGTTITCDFVNRDGFADPDGKTYHAIFRFRVLQYDI